MKSEEYNNYKKRFCLALKADRIDNVIEISENELRHCITNIPKNFFRYRRICEHTDAEIIEGQVYLSNPKGFDDVFDSKCYIDNNGVGDAVIENYLSSVNIAQSVPDYYGVVKKQDEYFQAVNDEIYRRLRIGCFTQKNDNVPMWYYYANKHTGICIEYDFSELKSFVELGYIFLPVIYPNKDETNNYRTGIFKKDTFNVSAVRNSLVKGNDWKFEKEWRIISLSEDPIVHLPVKKIYLGYAIENSDKNHLISLVKSSSKKIPIYQMRESVVGLKAEKIKY
jgi:hypothetical protein